MSQYDNKDSSTNAPTTPIDDNIPLPRVQQYQQKVHSRARLFTNFKKVATEQFKAQNLAHQSLYHVYHPTTGKKETIRSLLENPATTEVWSQSSSNEYGRLLKGNKAGIQGTNTMEPCKLQDIPSGKAITYATTVCDYRPLKKETHRSRLVVGGDKLPYAHDVAAPATSLLEAKILFNSSQLANEKRCFLVLTLKIFSYHHI